MQAATLAVALLGTSALAAPPRAAAPAAQPAAPTAAKRPNFLVIVADDLGFSDIGAFGGEIATPNLDALAARGVKLTGFHSAPTCSPTRSMLLSGTDNHLAGLGSMAELLAPNQVGKPGHEGYLRPDVASLAELMDAGGYRTIMSGKWHLGLTPEQDPHARGFRQSFALLQGGHNHFGNDVAAAPGGRASTYRENGRTLTALPDRFYSSDTFATKLIEYLDAGASGPERDKPFFAYLTFTAPHWPLQAPPETIAKYKGRYDAGYEVLRDQRLKRQVALGLLDPKAAAHPLDFRGRPLGWSQLSPEKKAEQARLMEIYAAMVDRMDENVGRVVAALKRTGEYDNTVILFLSDNGAEGADLAGSEMFASRVAAGDNRLANLGAATSYAGYGPGWAQAGTAPSWLFKAYTTEGGTRVPAFAAGPGIARAGGASSAFGTVMDVAPTLLDLAHIKRPDGAFAGRRVQPIRGTSWASHLAGKAGRVHPADEATGWELFGARGLRQGDWKLVHIGSGAWRLFNLADDPGETRDLAAAEPERTARLAALWDGYAREVGVVLPSEAKYRP
ncbi:MAG: arylsulfatase [Sphingomonas sp.]